MGQRIFVKRVKAQLRFETYNTFNHTQFSSVDQTAMPPTFPLTAQSAQVVGRTPWSAADALVGLGPLAPP